MGKSMARVGNLCMCSSPCSHYLPCCPHFVTGTISSGTSLVDTGGIKGALIGSAIVHNCPHCGVGMTIEGAIGSTLENTAPHRKDDMVTFFCGIGMTIEGFDNSTA